MGSDASTSDGNLAEIERLKAEIEALRGCLLRQLPSGMMSETIILKKCVLGHKRLLAAHWVDDGCLECAIGHLKAEAHDEDY